MPLSQRGTSSEFSPRHPLHISPWCSSPQTPGVTRTFSWDTLGLTGPRSYCDSDCHLRYGCLLKKVQPNCRVKIYQLFLCISQALRVWNCQKLTLYIFLFSLCLVINVTLIQKGLALCSLGENPWLCNRAGVQINKVNYGDKVTMTDNHWLMSSADRPLWGKGDFNHMLDRRM